jgi:heme/copper-type cytochrome/quinol oxidase subunit 2
VRKVHLWISLLVGTGVWGVYFLHVARAVRADDLNGLIWGFLAALIAAVALEAGATSVVAWLFRKRARDLDDGPSLNAALKAGHVALMALIVLLLGLAFTLALASRFGWSLDFSTARAQTVAANVLLGLVVLTELIRAAFTLMLLPRR